MKYRSISLNGNKGYHYSLVKYSSKYKNYLRGLRNLNPEFADSVKECAKNNNEMSEEQSYMIFQGDCYDVGAIDIKPSTDGKNLEVKIQLNEKYFKPQQEMLELINQIVESLKVFFYDKENIEINLINDIDLSKINPYKFHKKVNDDNLTTYICTNERNNLLIPKLVEEVTSTEKNLMDWGQAWWQNIDDNEFHYEFDKELLDEIEKGTVSLPDLFNKVNTILWTRINSNNSTRCISFSRNGNIEFAKSSDKKNNRIDYRFSYNILSDGFNLKNRNFKDWDEETLEIDENSYFTNIKANQLSVLRYKSNNKKRINYTSPVVDNSSIAVEIYTDENNEIESCYVDFRTHKNNGKINGLYALRIAPQIYNNKFTIRFISRKGDISENFSEEFSQNEEELFSAAVDGKLTFELIDELIRKIIPVINNRANYYKKQTISSMNETVIASLINSEAKVINFLKEIKGEIPLPHLHENLEKFINENTISKNNNKKIILK